MLSRICNNWINVRSEDIKIFSNHNIIKLSMISRMLSCLPKPNGNYYKTRYHKLRPLDMLSELVGELKTRGITSSSYLYISYLHICVDSDLLCRMNYIALDGKSIRHYSTQHPGSCKLSLLSTCIWKWYLEEPWHPPNKSILYQCNDILINQTSEKNNLLVLMWFEIFYIIQIISEDYTQDQQSWKNHALIFSINVDYIFKCMFRWELLCW